jgi:hypothetical protein
MHDTLHMLNIRPFELATDLRAAFGLWCETLNTTWPLDETRFRRILLGSATRQSGAHLVAEHDGQFACWLGGGDRRFWPGVPANLPDTIAFWERQG